MKKNKTLLVLSLIGVMGLSGLTYSAQFTSSLLSKKSNLVTRQKLGRLNPEKKEESLNAVGEIALETLDQYVDANKYSISRILEIKDFGDNQYVLVEFNPIGYLIYNVSNGDIVECAPTSYSPYLKTKSKNLYYLPMVGYFSNISGKYTNLMEEKEVNDLEFEAYKKESKRFHSESLTKIDEKNLTRTYAGSKVDVKKVRKNSTVTNYGFTNLIYADTEVPYSWYFKKNGLNFAIVDSDTGCCGYVALGLVLSYCEIFNSAGYFSEAQAESYITPYYGNQYGVGVPIVADEFLYELSDDPEGITQAEIIDTVHDFMYNKGKLYTIEHTAGIFTNISKPIEDGYPAIYCGTMPDFYGGSGAHGVVVYGTYDNGDVLCHYGWLGYSQVIMTNLGLFNQSGAISIYNRSEHVHNKYFIINQLEYCGCGEFVTC